MVRLIVVEHVQALESVDGVVSEPAVEVVFVCVSDDYVVVVASYDVFAAVNDVVLV